MLRKVVALGIAFAIFGFGGFSFAQTTSGIVSMQYVNSEGQLVTSIGNSKVPTTTGTKTPEQQANYERRVAEHEARIKAVLAERRTSPTAGALPSTAGMTKDERIQAHQERINAIMKANRARRQSPTSESLTAN